ncbi:dinitrogenase iron-molybdenum cofactor biosynthesis protein [bacterium]|nr:dinitrogenase iron-molybdenum cofactor biosynthesis protein [bacterium]
MKIAIGSRDGEKLQIGHFGMSPFFMLYEIDEEGNAKFLEKMINPLSNPKLHKHADTKDIMDLLPYIEVFIGKRMGKESKINIKAKFNKIAITYEDLDSVENALNRFLQEELRR